MSETIDWIAAQAEESQHARSATRRRQRKAEVPIEELPAHQFPATGGSEGNAGELSPPDSWQAAPEDLHWSPTYEEDRQRRIYRRRTVGMLRKYMRYSIETGRLPSLLGREFFRSKVTKYIVVTFEDRVIFVHDMETCLAKLDEFSRELIARHILQEHDRWATAKLLHCNEKTIRRLTPLVLDTLSEILLDVGLLERMDGGSTKSCQGGKKAEIFVSDCEDGKNTF